MAYDDRDDEDIDLRVDRPKDDHATAQLAHWGGFLMGVVLPLILYLVQPDKGSFAAWHARESLNFQISLMLYYGVAAAPMCLCFVDPWFLAGGLVLVGVVALLELILIVAASIAVSRGDRFRYPLTIPFVRRPKDPREDNDYVDRD